MAFETEHEMEADGTAGAEVWDALLKDAIAGKRNAEAGYSYVYVSETLPEQTTLWHNGKTVITAPANTGIPGAETELGTFPVFEHLEETTMSGENPDGSHYEDPGIMWVSYFNGGDALHTFDRASYGSPQSLGCVEMRLEDAADDLALHAGRHPRPRRSLRATQARPGGSVTCAIGIPQRRSPARAGLLGAAKPSERGR